MVRDYFRFVNLNINFLREFEEFGNIFFLKQMASTVSSIPL
jgi:hypothetical protein